MKKRIGAGKSYADILTVLLVIIIIAIIALLSYFAFKVIDKKNVETTASTTNDEFLAAAEANKKKIEKKKEEEVEVPTEIDFEKANAVISDVNNGNSSEQQDPSSSSTGSSAESNVDIKKTYLGNYEVKGSIDISKTNCKYPILERVTVDSLKKSIAIMDVVVNPELNRTTRDLNVPGTNAFILGHNYRNGQFFSNNDKLAVGDKIKITDQTGTTVTYTIYNMFYTTPDDVSFMERDVDINTREITLQTCNEDSSERLIIFAKDN